jgi:hypothetical protein
MKQRAARLPAMDGVILYEWLREHGPFPDLSPPLPDEPPVEPGTPRFVSGFRDGTAAYHRARDEHPDGLDELADALVATVDGGGDSVDELYQVAVRRHDAQLLFALLPRLAESHALDSHQQRVFSLAWFLATTAVHRGPVRLGIVLTGMFAPLTAEDEETLLVLGRHDEFALLVADVFEHAAADPPAALRRLAEQTRGWGRIHAVERLATSGDPRMLDWIVRTGYRNAIRLDYLTPLVALHGDLYRRMLSPTCDTETLHAVADVLITMCYPTPPRPFRHRYADGPRVTELFLTHLGAAAPDVHLAAAARAVRDFLTAAPDGWGGAVRGRLLERCEQLLARPEWRHTQ